MIELDFDKTGGLIPVIVADHNSNEVLMLAYMNKESWNKSLDTGKACYFSRSRQQLWLKGESSGNFQIIKDILIDCDNDTILLKVDQVGGTACHTGYRSCFYRKYDNGKLKIIGEQIKKPEEMYGKK